MNTPTQLSFPKWIWIALGVLLLIVAGTVTYLLYRLWKSDKDKQFTVASFQDLLQDYLPKPGTSQAAPASATGSSQARAQQAGVPVAPAVQAASQQRSMAANMGGGGLRYAVAELPGGAIQLSDGRVLRSTRSISDPVDAEFRTQLLTAIDSRVPYADRKIAVDFVRQMRETVYASGNAPIIETMS